MKILIGFSAITFIFLAVSASLAQTSAFTYQGRLTDGGSPAGGTYEMEFRLFKSNGTTQVGTTITNSTVSVAQGIFTVELDFGAAAFDGTPRLLQIAVRRNANEQFVPLSPQQPILSAPYSIKSKSAEAATNAAQLGGIPAANYLQTNGDGSNLSNVAKLDQNNVFTAVGNTFPQITLSGNGQIFAPRLENSAADPAAASAANAGRIYFNTTDKTIKISDGTQWRSLGSTVAAPQISRFVLYDPAEIRCNGTNSTLHTITFNKLSPTSKLRISYWDFAASQFFTSPGIIKVDVRIDNSNVSPVPLETQFNMGANSLLRQTFFILGYAENVSAGSHTLTTRYVSSGNDNKVCWRNWDGSSGLYRTVIEIEEIP